MNAPLVKYSDAYCHMKIKFYHKNFKLRFYKKKFVKIFDFIIKNIFDSK